MAGAVESTRPQPRGAVLDFAPVALALFCIQLDFFALGLALPVIADELGTTTTDLQWAVSAYMLALGALMIPASRLADLVGRKRVLLIGVAAFGLASLLCGLATTPGLLIAARVAQGVGGALILPVAFSLISGGTSADVRPRILGAVVGVANIGTALGPIVGGVLASSIGWRWVFFVNVPFAIAALLWGSRTLRESRGTEGRTVRDLDWLGLIFVALGVAAFSFGLDGVSAFGLLAPLTIGSLVLGVALLLVFARQERRHPWPLVSPALMRRKSFVQLLAAGTIANLGYCLMVIVVTVQLQQVRDFSSAVAGLVFAFPAAFSALCGPLSGRLAPRLPGGQVMAVSICLGAIGLLIQALFEPLVLDIVGLSLSGISFGMGYTFTQIATQSVLPQSLSSEASGVVLTTVVTLGALGIIVGSLALELLGPDLAAATTSTLLWAGVVFLVIGAWVAWTQRHAARPGADVVA
jgi:MFS family permease